MFKYRPLFVKIMLLVLTVLVISLIATSIIYNMAAKSLFAKHQLDKLREESDLLAYLIQNEWSNKDYLIGFFSKVIQVESTLLSSYVVVADRFNIETYSYTPDDYTMNKRKMDYFYASQLKEYFKKAVAGQNIVLVEKFDDFDTEMIVIIRPILSEQNQVEAVLTICKYVEDYDASYKSINYSLSIIMAIVAFLTLFPVYLFSKSITKPLKEIENTALKMADGNFTIKANEEYPNEIGQLAKTMNYLASRLSRTILHLTRETNVLQGVLNTMNEGILALDTHGNIMLKNPAISNLFKSSNLETEKDMIIPIQEIWDDFEKSIENNMEITNIFRFEDKIILSIINPLMVENVVIGAMGIFSDTTKEYRLEQTRRDYVANVSHELKTPLTGIMGLVEPLKDGLIEDEERKEKYYNLIYNEVNRLNRLINDLLILSRLQSSTDPFSTSIINLQELVYNIIERYTLLHKGQNIIIKSLIEDSIYINGNIDRIDHVLTILLENAIKFSKQDDTLELASNQTSGLRKKQAKKEKGILIEISAEIEDDICKVMVKDYGIGISKETIEHVFDRFYKVDTSRSSKGFGLGLAIAKETLNQMNQTIGVESEINDGSTFYFTLELAKKD